MNKTQFYSKTNPKNGFNYLRVEGKINGQQHYLGDIAKVPGSDYEFFGMLSCNSTHLRDIAEKMDDLNNPSL
jgi:hypothetical protein